MLGGEFHSHFGGDGLSDFRLERDDVAEVAVVLVGPKRLFADGRDEARGDTDSIARLEHRTFHNSVDVQFAGDFAHRERGVLELHDGLARDDTKAGALAKLRDEFFGDAIGKELAFGVAGEIGEGEHGNGLYFWRVGENRRKEMTETGDEEEREQE